MEGGPEEQKETSGERAQADIGVDTYLDNKGVDKAVSQVIKEASNYQSERRRARGDSNLITQKTEVRTPRTATAGTKMTAAIGNASDAAATAAGTETKIRDNRASTLKSLAGTVSGETDQAIQGLGTLAARSGEDAQRRAERRQANSDVRAAGTLQALGAAGSLANESFSKTTAAPAAAYNPGTNLAPPSAATQPLSAGLHTVPGAATTTPTLAAPAIPRLDDDLQLQTYY